MQYLDGKGSHPSTHIVLARYRVLPASRPAYPPLLLLHWFSLFLRCTSERFDLLNYDWGFSLEYGEGGVLGDVPAIRFVVPAVLNFTASINHLTLCLVCPIKGAPNTELSEVKIKGVWLNVSG